MSNVIMSGKSCLAFSLLGQAEHPKRFAGLVATAPSVAVPSLALTVAVKGPTATVPYAQGMLIGSADMLAYCLVSLYLIERLHALLGSVLAWLASSRTNCSRSAASRVRRWSQLPSS
jgi:hypothetical protein